MIKEFMKNATILSITQIILSLKGLVMVPLLTKTFGAVDYGIWAQVSVIVSMIVPLIIMGTDQSMIRFVSGKDNIYAKKAISTELLYVFLLSIIVGIVLYLTSQPLAGSFFGSKDNYKYVAICGYVILTTTLLSICMQWYRINNNTKIYSIITLSESFLIAFLAVGVVLFHGDILTLVLVTSTGDAIIIIILLIHIFMTLGITMPSSRLLIEFLKFGIPIMPAGYAMWVLNGSDRLLIGHFGTMADLGIYSVAYSLGYILISFFFGPTWLIYPIKATELFNKGKISEINILFNYSMKASLGLIIPAMFGFGVLSVQLLLLVSTPDFIRGAYIIPLITIAYSFHMIGYFFSVSLGLNYKQKYTTYCMIIAAILNIILNIFLIPILGILGAALATCIAFFVQMIIQAYIGNRSLPLSFDWKFIEKSILSSILMSIIIYLINPSGIIYMILSIIIGAMIYLLSMLLLHALSQQEIIYIIDLLRLQKVKNNRFACVILGIKN